MKYLIMADINTNEILHKIELEMVLNVAVFKGDKINTIGGWYGCHCEKDKEYIMVQYDDGNKFILGEAKRVYIYFNN